MKHPFVFLILCNVVVGQELTCQGDTAGEAFIQTKKKAATAKKNNPVPAYLQDFFPGSKDGENGESVRKVWDELESQGAEMKSMKVPNLFELSPYENETLLPSEWTGTWRFKHSMVDWGEPYYLPGSPKPEDVSRAAHAQIMFTPLRQVEQVTLEDGLVEEDINYAARIVITGGAGGSKPRYIYVPGSKTYDIAGMTGDAHASERIGGACDSSNVAILTSVVVAMRATGNPNLVHGIFMSNYKLIQDLHNRWTLASYMWDQAYAAFLGRERQTYAQFVRGFLPALQQQPCFTELLEDSDTRRGTCHDHALSYLQSLQLPPEFYGKICGDIASQPETDGWKIQAKPILCDPEHPHACSPEACQ